MGEYPGGHRRLPRAKNYGAVRVTARSASVAVSSGLAYVLGDDNTFYALDATTGKEKWKKAISLASPRVILQPRSCAMASST